MKKSAVISDCGLYRYSLTRDWSDFNEESKVLMIVGLNPSTADAINDDPTIRRCVGFAKSWGFNKIIMTNLFAYRSTDPGVLSVSSVEPVGKLNDDYLKKISAQANMTLVAWGSNHMVGSRDLLVLKLLKNPKCLGVTKAGHPKHPLYIKGDTRPIAYSEALISVKDQ